MANKTFTVDKESFQKEFLNTITKFKASSEFLPIHFINNRLTVFCNHRVIVKNENKGTIGLYINYEPDSSTLEEGDVFYVKYPDKLEKTLALVDSERIVFKLTNSHLRAESDNEKFGFRLYDPMMASRDRTFWIPKKFDNIRNKMTDGVILNKIQIDKIQKICNIMGDDTATIDYSEEDGKNYLYIGKSDIDSFRVEIPHYNGFSNFSNFSKYIFNVTGKGEVNLAETNDNKIITLINKTEKTEKYCFVTKFADS